METIILVHGVGLWGTEMFLLKYRLQKLGYQCQQFCYSTRRQTLAENAENLIIDVTKKWLDWKIQQKKDI